MNFINKFWIIYFLITPILCLHNKTETEIYTIQENININYSYNIPFIIKVWICLEILHLL